jgi:hypothetical protein
MFIQASRQAVTLAPPENRGSTNHDLQQQEGGTQSTNTPNPLKERDPAQHAHEPARQEVAKVDQGDGGYELCPS